MWRRVIGSVGPTGDLARFAPPARGCQIAARGGGEGRGPPGGGVGGVVRGGWGLTYLTHTGPTFHSLSFHTKPSPSEVKLCGGGGGGGGGT